MASRSLACLALPRCEYASMPVRRARRLTGEALEFCAPTPWPSITAVLRSAKRRTAVTAYLGKGAADLLPLYDDDMLVVDASDAAVRAGATNPFEIRRFYQRNVRCYSVARLHAKVYVGDDHVFCASANASKHSQASLIECAVGYHDIAFARAVLSWVQTLPLIRLDVSELARLEGIYRPPKWESAKQGRGGRKRARAWIVWLDKDVDVPEDDEYDEWRERASKNLRRQDLDIFEICETRKTPSRVYKNVRPGDELFVIDHRDGEIVAYKPMRVLQEPFVDSSARKTRRWLALEAAKDLEQISYTRVLHAASSGGLTLSASGKSSRELRPEVAAEIRSLWEL